MFAATAIIFSTTLPAICHHAIKGAGATIAGGIASATIAAVTDSDGDRTRRQRFARRVQNRPPSTATAYIHASLTAAPNDQHIHRGQR